MKQIETTDNVGNIVGGNNYLVTSNYIFHYALGKKEYGTDRTFYIRRKNGACKHCSVVI